MQIKIVHLLGVKYDDIRKVIEQNNSEVDLNFVCYENKSENQLSYWKSSEFKQILRNSNALQVRLFYTFINWFFIKLPSLIIITKKKNDLT